MVFLMATPYLFSTTAGAIYATPTERFSFLGKTIWGELDLPVRGLLAT